MRIRSIKPEFWRSQDISALPIEHRLLFIGLWSYVDDNGVGRDSLASITADLFADDLERDPRETFARVERGLDALSSRGMIRRYVVENKRYVFMTAWESHQKIDRPSKPRYPLPTSTIETLDESSRDTREDDATPSLRARVGTGEQGAGEQGADAAQSAGTNRGSRLPQGWEPTEELRRQMAEERPDVNLYAEHLKFVDHWTAKTGRDATKLDWAATWRNWIRNARATPPSGNRRQNETDQIFSQAAAWAAAQDQKAIAG